MNNIKVSFILINYNGYSDTVECINSLLAMENYKSDVSIVVVDNASVVYKEELKNFCQDNNVKHVQMDYNAGFGVANNYAAEYAINNSADYIILLNNDTVVATNMLEEMEKCFTEDAVISPVIYYYDYPNDIWCAGGEISILKGTSVHYHILTDKKVSFLTGCCISIPAKIYNKYGLFDDKFFMYYEDTDLSVRYKKNNVLMKIVRNAKIWHKVGKSSDRIYGLKDYYLTRNRLYMIRKHKDFFINITCFLYFVITRLLLLVLCIRSNKSPIYYWYGIIDFYKKRFGEMRKD